MSSTKSKFINLKERGFSEEMSANGRAQLASFSEEWDSPKMDIYDDYDNLKNQHKIRKNSLLEWGRQSIQG